MSTNLSSLLLLLLLWFHSWEKQYFLDAVRVRHEHGKSINTDTPASSWWETVLEGVDKVSIDGLSFIVTHILGLGLVLESFQLYLGVVQLGVSVDDFVEVAEKFESF